VHRILLREVVIDVPADRRRRTEVFWSEALLTRTRRIEGHDEFTALEDPAALCVVGLQDIGTDAARLHLDIETDDVEAEVARLVRLGAVEEARVRSWVVLRDPAGLLFCVVPPDSPDFEDRSRTVP
jgi:hypothetical protein